MYRFTAHQSTSKTSFVLALTMGLQPTIINSLRLLHRSNTFVVLSRSLSFSVNRRASPTSTEDLLQQHPLHLSVATLPTIETSEPVNDFPRFVPSHSLPSQSNVSSINHRNTVDQYTLCPSSMLLRLFQCTESHRLAGTLSWTNLNRVMTIVAMQR